MIQFYGYDKCSTCVKAKKFLLARFKSLECKDIVSVPPPKVLFKKALATGYTLKDLFNKSGELYRSLNMKEKLPKLSESEALDLLAANGKLVKRPFMVDEKTVVVGYDEARMEKLQ